MTIFLLTFFLAHVVVPLLHPETSKTECRLPSSPVLLGEVDGELVEDVPGVALQGAEQGAVTIHHNETEPREEVFTYILTRILYYSPYWIQIRETFS